MFNSVQVTTPETAVHTFSAISPNSQFPSFFKIRLSKCAILPPANWTLLFSPSFPTCSFPLFFYRTPSLPFTLLHFTCHQHHVGPTTQNHSTMTNGPMEIAVLAMLNFHHLPPMSLPFLLSYTYPTQPWALNDPR